MTKCGYVRINWYYLLNAQVFLEITLEYLIIFWNLVSLSYIVSPGGGKMLSVSSIQAVKDSKLDNSFHKPVHIPSKK